MTPSDGDPPSWAANISDARLKVVPDPLLTISVDDGYPSDQRAAELLATLGYSATFYLPARNEERAVIGVAGVREIAQSFEVGAHTYNHVPLPSLSDQAARRELADGKSWLEDAVSAPVTSFCYPGGKFNRRATKLVAEAGFAGARTTMGNIVAHPTDSLLAGTTSQAFSHRRIIHTRHAVLEGNWNGVRNFARIFRLKTDWTDHFELGVSHVCARGGVAHLWFHSWEMDQHDEWFRMEQLLRRLKERYQFRCVTNGELFEESSGLTET